MKKILIIGAVLSTIVLASSDNDPKDNFCDQFPESVICGGGIPGPGTGPGPGPGGGP